MNKYVNKKLLLRKIKKSSKQDEIECPAGMCSGEGRHRENDFCFKEEKKEQVEEQRCSPTGRLHCWRCGER